MISTQSDADHTYYMQQQHLLMLWFFSCCLSLSVRLGTILRVKGPAVAAWTALIANSSSTARGTRDGNQVPISNTFVATSLI
jgi:hypothetical protein